MSTGQLLKAFRSALGETDNASTFACGGHIPITVDHSAPARNDTFFQAIHQAKTTKPVTIRFGIPGQGQTLVLPTDTTTDPALDHLISTCEPAAFGRGGKDVFDDNYRKATKLDVSDFCTLVSSRSS
jgi:hypothetical protein